MLTPGVAVFQPGQGRTGDVGAFAHLLCGEPLQLAPGEQVFADLDGGTARARRHRATDASAL